jgi:hypothetical protein
MGIGIFDVATAMGSIVGMTGTTVTDPAGTSRDGYSVSIISSTNNPCNGDSTGTATALATGGTTSYTYSWDDPLLQATATADSLPAGTYKVMVTDGTGCVDSASVTITEPATLAASISDSLDVNCMGDSSGYAAVTPTGGTGPYTYLWDDPNTQTDSLADGLPAGNYNVTVTDTNGCQVIVSTSIATNSAITLALSSSVPVACNTDSSATITATAAGGTGTLNYLWDDSGAQTTAVATGLANGTYSVVVTDTNGCSVMDSLSFGLVASVSSSTDPVCGSFCNGTATLLATGGSGPLTYLWDDPNTQTTVTVSNLCSGGTFTGIATDSAGCSAMASVTLTAVSPLLVELDITHVNCFGDATGAITAHVTGGGGGYQYMWPSLGSNSAVVNTLLAGNYDVIVTDANNCSVVNTGQITEPAAALSSSIVATPASCFGGSDGIANLSVTGGASPYAYQWEKSTNQDTSGLHAGSFIVTITDANGCPIIDTATITEPSSLTLSGSSSSDLGNNSGQAWVSASGATPPYTYLWDDASSQSNDTATVLAAGQYSVLVTDDNGCTNTLQIVVGDVSVGVFETCYEGALDDLARDVDILSGGGHIIAGYTESFGVGGSDVFLVKTDVNGNFSWAKTYGGTGDDGANSILETSDGGYIMAGYTESFGSGGYDMYVVKTDASGVVDWTMAYGGSLDDRAYSIVEVSGGGYTIAGGTSSTGAGSTDVYVVNIDDNGAVQWTQTYGGS